MDAKKLHKALDKTRNVTVGELRHILKYYPDDKEVIVLSEDESFVFRGPIAQEWEEGVCLYTKKNVPE